METTPITSGSLPLTLAKTNGAEVSQAASSFSDFLQNTIDQVGRAQNEGDKAILDLQGGQARNLHEVMIATEEADIAIRMLVQMRNKAMEAYNEVMRIQI